MNEVLETKLTLDQFRKISFGAMSVPASVLYDRAMSNPRVQAFLEASKSGKLVRYESESGTDLTFSLDGRPIILDRDDMQNLALGGTGEVYERITNKPNGEAFATPVEGSVNGVVVFNAPLSTGSDRVVGPYKIYFENGLVTKVEGSNEAGLKVLKDVTGLVPRKFPESVDALAAHGLRRLVGEVAIAGLNPVLDQAYKAGLLSSAYPSTIISEKLADHFAVGTGFGKEAMFDVGDHHGVFVPHTDFMTGTENKKVTLIG